MSAPITTTATTLVGQFIEVAIAIQNAEITAQETNPEFEPQLTLAGDFEAGAITLAATVPSTVGGTAGSLTLTPQDYLA